MSDVRLSNGSPTLERTEPRVPEHPKPSACRVLFGPVDHGDLEWDIKQHLRDMEKADAAEWDFDFARGAPLLGERLEWQAVDGRDVPEFYSRPVHRKRGVRPAGTNRVDLNGNRRSSPATAAAAAADGPQSECAEQCAGIRKRPASHDASAQSKRSNPGSDERSCPTLSHSAEHTPRKSSPKRLT